MNPILTPDELAKIMGSVSQPVASNQQPNLLPKMEKLMQNFNILAGYTNHLEQGLTAISMDLFAVKNFLGFIKDLCIEKGVATEEEYDAMFNEKVAIPTKEKFEELQSQQEQAMKEQVQQDNKKKETDLREEEESDQEEESKVILASERFHK